MLCLIFPPADSPENELSDSDSDTEDLVEIKIDDWLVFELEKQVWKHQHPLFNLKKKKTLYVKT